MAQKGQRVQSMIAAQAVADGLSVEEAVEQRGCTPSGFKKAQRIRDVDRGGTIFAKVISGEMGMQPAAVMLGLHKTAKLREALVNDSQKKMSTQDLFDEATTPLLTQAKFYERINWDFPHVSPVEARRRLEVIDRLQIVLAKTRTALTERSHTYTTRAPDERKCA